DIVRYFEPHFPVTEGLTHPRVMTLITQNSSFIFGPRAGALAADGGGPNDHL
ncbi:hypothetical protein HAX54_006345, partial [Datura stramonium]|nr:hypothetical protein [Datura stramonium]